MAFLLKSPFTLSPNQSLSSSSFLSLLPKLSHLSLIHRPTITTTIRMGGGPRTYPGGVSKWQWKRMQAKKAKQLLKARLARERHIYEMRKRAELKAAVSALECPWEAVPEERKAAAPTLFSVSADEQLKVLADRFQKPEGFDLWTERDGPQLFQTPDGVPTARFFPKGVVHSGRVDGVGDFGEEERNKGKLRRINDGYGLNSMNSRVLDRSEYKRSSMRDNGKKDFGGKAGIEGNSSRERMANQDATRGSTKGRMGRNRGRQSSDRARDGSLSEGEGSDGDRGDFGASRVFNGNRNGKDANATRFNGKERKGSFRNGNVFKGFRNTSDVKIEEFEFEGYI